MELANVGLALRKGHRVTVFWGIIQGQEHGPYVAIYNHATNSLTKIHPAVQGLASRPASGWVPLAWLASIFGICLYGLGIIGIIILFVVGRKRKRKNQELTDTLQAAVDGVIAEAKGA